MKKQLRFLMILMIGVVASCNTANEFELPAGRQGEQGEQGIGIVGITANGNCLTIIFSDASTTEVCGIQGERGENGLTPEIKNGTWWIGGIDTEVKVTGEDGKTPSLEFYSEFNEAEMGIDIYYVVNNGDPVHIGFLASYIPRIEIINNEWYIDGEPTGVIAVGKDGIDGLDGEDGADGKTPKLCIKNGYWYIDGKIAGKATGKDGSNGYTPEIAITSKKVKGGTEIWYTVTINGVKGKSQFITLIPNC